MLQYEVLEHGGFKAGHLKSVLLEWQPSKSPQAHCNSSEPIPITAHAHFEYLVTFDVEKIRWIRMIRVQNLKPETGNRCERSLRRFSCFCD